MFCKADDVGADIVHVVKYNVETFMVVIGIDSVDVGVVYSEVRWLFRSGNISHEFVVCWKVV